MQACRFTSISIKSNFRFWLLPEQSCNNFLTVPELRHLPCITRYFATHRRLFLSSVNKIFAMSLKNRTVLITGATRGIGKAMALKLAADGANIVIAAKSVGREHQTGGHYLHSGREVEAAGGKALAVQCDIRF
jgi:lactate dehydrogenase-like 2-hydroxyacid dehydrogenase